MRYQCKCCEYFSLPEESVGNDNICPICFWHDDFVQQNDPDFEGGANKESLNQARMNYHNFGAVNKASLRFVRKPTEEEQPMNNV